jgi:LysM repeat protein
VPTETPTPEPVTYTVQPGDNLTRIARDHGVTLEALIEANDIENPNVISVGQVLIIPPVEEPTAEPAEAETEAEAPAEEATEEASE